MFLKSQRHDPPSKAQAGGLHGTESHSTFISADMKVGGDVRGRKVSVGAEGVVMGDITAEFADIAGTVHGRVEAVSVSVARGAKIAGTITHNEIEIESGAKLDSRRPWRPPSYFDQNRKW